MALYKKTFIHCSIIMVSCLILSWLLLFPCISENNIVIFIRDYLVGSTCSLIVVVITTYIQFRYEQKKNIASVLSKVQFFFFDYELIAMAFDPEESIPIKYWEYCFEKIEKSVEEISAELLKIEWFSKDKEKMAQDFLCQLLLIRKDLILKEDKSKEDIIRGIMGSSVITDVKNKALILANSDDYKFTREKIIEYYEKAENYLKEFGSNTEE